MTADELCACGRRPIECAADPRSRLGAIAMVAAHREATGLPLSVVLDEHACLTGVCNALAGFAGMLVGAQAPGWLPSVALGVARSLEAA